MVNTSMRVPADTGAPLPPALLSAQSDTEIERVRAIAAVESYKLSMRVHHEPLSNSAKLLVLRAKEDKMEEARLLALETGLATNLKLA